MRMNRRPGRRDKWALSGKASKRSGPNLLWCCIVNGTEEFPRSLSHTSPLVSIDQGCRERERELEQEASGDCWLIRVEL